MFQVAQAPGSEPQQERESTPAQTVRPEIKKPEQLPGVGRYNPNEELPKTADPATDPETWVKTLIRDGNGRYASTYLTFKDSDNKVVAVVPIELQNRNDPSRTTEPKNDFPVFYVSDRDVLDVTGISFRAADKAEFGDTPVAVDEKDQSSRERYGLGPEGGSGYGVRFRLETVSKQRDRNSKPFPGSPDISSPTDGTFAIHGRITFDNNGQPSRALPLGKSRLVRPSGNERASLVTINGQQYEEKLAYLPDDSVRTLRTTNVNRDAPQVEVTAQAVKPSATIDYDKVTVDGERRSYPISFEFQKPNESGTLEPSQTVAGTLVLGDGAPRVLPADNALLQSAFAKMKLTQSPAGQPEVRLWSRPMEPTGQAESNAIIKLDGKTVRGAEVQPVAFTSTDGKSRADAYLYVDSDKKLHLLPGESVTLIRPEFTSVQPVNGQEGVYTATILILESNTDSTFSRKAVPVQLRKSEEGFSISYDESQKSINDGTQGSYTVEQAKQALATVIRGGQVDVEEVEGKGPVLKAVLPPNHTSATADSVALAQGLLSDFEYSTKENGGLGPSSPVPVGVSQTLSVEIGDGSLQSVSLDSYVPPGIELSQIQFRQPTLLNGVKVLPFSFATTAPVDGALEHTGYLRVAEGNFGMRQVGTSGAIRFGTNLYIDGVQLFSTLHKDKHSDNGFIPLRKSAE